MSNTRLITTAFITAAILIPADTSKGQVTKQQAEQIEAAAPAKASAAPKKNRRGRDPVRDLAEDVFFAAEFGEGFGV